MWVAPSHGIEQSIPGLSVSKVYYWIEPENQPHSVSEVLQEADWQAVEGELNFGYSNATLWVMQNIQAYRKGDWVMQVPYPLLDYLDIYLYKGDELHSSVHSGDARPFSERLVKVPDFVLGMSNTDPTHFRLVARVETQGTMMFPVKWWSEIEYAEHLAKEQIIYGAYYGVLLVMAFYHLFIYLVIKERGYLFYVLTVSSFLLLQLSFDGRAFAWFWPNSPSINHFSFPFSYCLYQLAVLTFMSTFLRLSSSSPRLYKYFVSLRLIVLMNVGLLFVLDYSIATPIIVLTGMITIISGLVSGGYLWMKGYTAARYFTCAWVLFLGGLLLVNLRGWGIGETTWFINYGYLMGSMLEVLFLAFSLADRISTATKERRDTEKALIKSKDEHVSALQKYQNLYENSPIGNFQSDQEYQLTSVNRACANIFGFQHRHDMLEKVKDIRPYLSSSFKDFQYMVRQARDHGSSNDNELIIKTETGEERWVSINLRYYQATPELGFEGTIQDITERKNAEKLRTELDQERLTIMEQFSLGIAKEISMPLGSNVATTAFVRDGLDDILQLQKGKGVKTENYERFISLISQSMDLVTKNQKRITEVVKRFREVSSWQLGLKTSHVAVLDLIESTVDAQRWRLAGWRVDIDCDPSLKIYTYKTALSSILIQLIDNALLHSFADDGQTPMIKIRVTEENKDTVIISFNDNGQGIKPELVKNLCKPFFTTKKGPDGHIGLGLYMIYNLVCQALKGRLFFPVKGQGFSIQMVIPQHLEKM
ncbi:MAG: PAS domain S-box-containing protein [Bermanella sp.]|jgi:PAS domain S-box-containing protein